MSIQSTNIPIILPTKYTPGTIAISTFPIAPIATISSTLEPFVKSSNSLDKTKLKSNALTILKSKEVEEARKATTILPNSVSNLEMQIDILSKIDISDPNSYEIITPTSIINYYENYYGDVDMKILEHVELMSAERSLIDKSSLAIDITRNTSLDFIAFDSGMAFLASNGTSPENLVIAENMGIEGTGFPVILSLNANSEQNLQLVQSSDTQSIELSYDIPLGLDTIDISDFILDISNRTETIQLISPDLVRETSNDGKPDIELGLLSGFLSGLFDFSQKGEGYMTNFFGTLKGGQVKQLLENPVKYKYLRATLPRRELQTGTFFLSIHGNIISSELVDVDCSSVEQLSFLGRNGLVLALNKIGVDQFGKNKGKVTFNPVKQTAVGKICRLPKIKFMVDKDTSEKMHGLFHINSDGKIEPVLTNYDMLQIFGDNEISLHTLLNLVQIISGGSQKVKLNIAACLHVDEFERSKPLHRFRIGLSEQDIPSFFYYFPKKIVPKEVERASGIAPDRFCKLGADALRDDASDMCSKFIAAELAKKETLDPNSGLSGDGIIEALSDNTLLPDIMVLFFVPYLFRDNMKYMNKLLGIRAEYFLHLQTWYNDGSIEQFFKSETISKLGIHSQIVISDILPEIDDVFQTFRRGEVITPKIFFAKLSQLLKIKMKQGLIIEINERITYRLGEHLEI